MRVDGNTVRFPVRNGDVAQARLRAALTQRPEDSLVAVTEDAYIRVGSALNIPAKPGIEERELEMG